MKHHVSVAVCALLCALLLGVTQAVATADDQVPVAAVAAAAEPAITGLSASAEGEGAAAAVLSQPSAQAMLVLDASGSMWGRVMQDGKEVTKIEAARGVIHNVLGTWPASIEMGVMAYGHRTKSDCKDIEQISPVATVDTNAIKTRLATINPVGKTPMTDAVVQAAEALKYTQQKATVILVSDGEETCHADPCAMAQTLEAKGIDFTAHVIGFDTSKLQQQHLQCLATNTGGLYLTADNAEELNQALETVKKVVEKAPEPLPVVQEEGSLLATIRLNRAHDAESLAAMGWKVSQWQLWQTSPEGVPIVRLDQALQLNSADDKTARAKLKVGHYLISAQLVPTSPAVCCGTHFAQSSFVITANQETPVSINMNMVRVTYQARASAAEGSVLNLPFAFRLSRVVDEDSTVFIVKRDKANPHPSDWLSAGNYVAEATIELNSTQPIAVKYPFVLSADEPSPIVPINFNVGTVVVQVQGASDRQSMFVDFLGAPDMTGQRAVVNSMHYDQARDKGQRRVILKAGDYGAVVKYQPISTAIAVTVKAAEAATVTLTAPKP